MKEFAFKPVLVQAAEGDTVVFRNEDAVPHTATSDAGTAGSPWSSGDIPPGRSWRWAARGQGDHPYHCEYHPTMKATIRVK